MALFVLVGLAVAVAGIALIVQGIQGNQGRLRNAGGGLVAAGVVIAFLSASFVVIPAGNRGVVFNVIGGVQDSELNEGVHIILPILQQVTVYDIRQQELTLARETNDEITARSSEGLEIIVDVTVLYQIEPAQVDQIHRDIGPSYETVRVRPEIRSQIRDGISEFNAASLISTERSELQQRIETNLIEGLSGDNIRVLSVLLRDVSIPESITRAIEEKQAAEQQIEVEENRRQQAEIAAQRRIVEAEGERDAQIARAQGEAEALSLRGQAIRENPEIIQLEAVERLSPSIQTIMLPTDSNFLLDVRSLTQGLGQNAPAQSGSQ